MRKYILTGFFVVTTLVFSLPKNAQADWCASDPASKSADKCGYETEDACFEKATFSGGKGRCYENTEGGGFQSNIDSAPQYEPMGPPASLANSPATSGTTQPSSSSCGNLSTLRDLVCEIKWLLDQALYFIFALAFLTFLWGVFKYIKKGGEEKERKAGVNFMWYGIVSLAVMFSVWGLVNFVLSTFKISAGVVPENISNVIQKGVGR